MKPRTAAGWAGILCLVWLAGPGGFAGVPAAGQMLIRLDTAGLDRLPSALGGRILVHTELDSGWIATVDRALAGILEARGASFEVLDPEPEGKKYFLIDPSAADGAGVAAFGRMRTVDARTILFWTDDGREAREVLPAAVAVKRLSLDSGRSLKAAAEDAKSAGRIMGRTFRPPVYDPRIAALVAQVSKDGLASDILTLQNFVTRYASTAKCELAGDFLYGYFSSLGLSAAYDPFTFSSYTSRNIVATIPGTVLPEYVVIVCAHYDSTTGSITGPTSAPGADDNASGTAAVMEIARIFAGRPFDFTVKFICFSAEEWGLYGSKHYAQAAKAAGEKILGVLNMDMIAYTDALPEDLDIFTDASSQWLANWFVLCARQYEAVDLAPAVSPSLRSSDHSSFWDQGYSALLAIEDYPLRNPYYHKTADVFSSLNLDFAASVTKIVLAVAAGMAQPGLQQFSLPSAFRFLRTAIISAVMAARS